MSGEEKNRCKTVLLYAGTTEGRVLAEQLAAAGIPCDVHVATAYGQMVMPDLPGIAVHVGRLATKEMRMLAQRGYAAVVDATHPFAVEASAQIKASVEGLSVPYLRLCRRMETAESTGEVRWFSDYESCAKALGATDGNVLLTTGSKELAYFCTDSLRPRVYVRVLPGLESIRLCEEAGICGRQILAMQGPFSKEMNVAMLHQFHIRYLVTKESGAHSGFAEKLAAAREAGAVACVIGTPKEEAGLSFAQVVSALTELLKTPVSCRPQVDISLIGIGMGTHTMTVEARAALDAADIVFGAPRMLKAAPADKEGYPFYLAKDILPVLEQKEQQMEGGTFHAAVLFSGDTGFYSGAQQLHRALKDHGYKTIRMFPGIASVSYLAAAAGTPWQDARILSIHGKTDGRDMQTLVLDAVCHHKKTFLLVSGVADVQKIGAWLEARELSHVRITVGYQLSYADERIETLTPGEAKALQKPGLYTLLLQNETPVPRVVVPGIPDAAFLRVQEKTRTVPMTKEEVRALCLCKLALTEDAVVYDVGSGTGSVAIECARRGPGIRVYAVEQKAAAQQLLRENIAKFGLQNVIPVDGAAPAALEALESPTHVFIGGSGGHLMEILQCVWAKNRQARIVITAVSLETIAQVQALLTPDGQGQSPVLAQIVQLQVSRVETVGGYHLLRAQNPVMVCTLQAER